MQRIFQVCESVSDELSENTELSECCGIISLTSTMALALLSCLQQLPLSFAVTSFNFSAEGGMLRELLLIATSAFHPTLQACGCVGSAFHTSQTTGTGLCCGSVPVLGADMV